MIKITREGLKKKIDKVAKSYCENHVRYMLWDCCDSMHGMDEDSARWEILTDNNTHIHQYIKENLADYYNQCVNESLKETGETIEDISDYKLKSLITS